MGSGWEDEGAGHTSILSCSTGLRGTTDDIFEPGASMPDADSCQRRRPVPVQQSWAGWSWVGERTHRQLSLLRLLQKLKSVEHHALLCRYLD